MNVRGRRADMAAHKGAVLVIDDEQPVRDYLCCILEHEGFTVYQATNGREGMSVIENNGIDLLITDLVMPDREGLETITGVRKTHPELRIIAMSGAASSEAYLRIANSLGARATIQKPFSRQTVIAAITSVMAG